MLENQEYETEVLLRVKLKHFTTPKSAVETAKQCITQYPFAISCEVVGEVVTVPEWPGEKNYLTTSFFEV